MDDCHFASAKGNLCKCFFDSIVFSGIAIFVTADHGVVSILSAGIGVPASAQYEQNVSNGIRSRRDIIVFHSAPETAVFKFLILMTLLR